MSARDHLKKAIIEKRAALLVIDMDAFYVGRLYEKTLEHLVAAAILEVMGRNAPSPSPWQREEQAAFLETMQELTAMAEPRMPVIHVVTPGHGRFRNHRWHKTRDLEGYFRQRPMAYALPPDAPVYMKTMDSAFDSTQLTRSLHARGIDTVLLAGINGDACVERTGLQANARGFRVFYMSAAIRLMNDCLLKGPALHAELVRRYKGQGDVIGPRMARNILNEAQPLSRPFKVRQRNVYAGFGYGPEA